MDESTESDLPWTEAESLRFIERGKIHTPARDEIQETILGLLPAERDDRFIAVELGVGGGWLAEAILERYPGSQLLGLDGSPAMLRETQSRLQRFSGRIELRRFRLEDRSWLSELRGEARCFVSSLVIHHLDGEGKRILYRDLFTRLEETGAVLIADLVAPRSDRERKYMAARWDAEVERQALAFTGTLDVYREFVDEHDNWFAYPDPMDMPSTIPQHLTWLEEAGFLGVDVFWARAGHVVYGGYKGFPPS